MDVILFITLLTIFLTHAAHAAQYCNYGNNLKYCSYDCCSDDCCAMPVALIVGIVISSVFGLAMCVGCIICIFCLGCKKKASTGTVVSPVHQNSPPVFINNSSAFGHPPPSYNQYNDYSRYPPPPGTGNNDTAYPPGTISYDHPPPYTGRRF